MTDYVASLESDLGRLQPVGRRLERPEEERLCQHCFALGLFEQVFRAGRARCLASSPLFVPEPKTTTTELLAIAQEHWLEDLCKEAGQRLSQALLRLEPKRWLRYTVRSAA